MSSTPCSKQRGTKVPFGFVCHARWLHRQARLSRSTWSLREYLRLILSHWILEVNISSPQMLRSNRSRDKQYGPADPKISADNGMQGMTDKYNTHFR